MRPNGRKGEWANGRGALGMVLAFAGLAQGQAVDHGAFDGILKEVVRDEGIDYAGVKDRHLPQLKRYLEALPADIASLRRDEQLALYINIYNASVIKAIAERWKPGYSVSEGDFGLFKEPIVNVGGKRISLDDLEQKIIRPTFKEPRIHVALVCGARSCPPILHRAYRADDLEAVLEANMRRFVADGFRNPIDVTKRELRLSKLFDWYAADFGGPEGVKAYVGRYLGKDVSDWRVSFVEYSWELNHTLSDVRGKG